MFKMSISSEYHADTILVTAINRVLVTNGATGLDDGGNAGLVGQFHAVVKGEEGVGSQHGAMEVEVEGLSLLDGLSQGVDP